MTFIPANPYPWPYDGDLRPANTALVIIDMQTDFYGKGGYIDGLGYDISLTRACIEPISSVQARTSMHTADHAVLSQRRSRSWGDAQYGAPTRSAAAGLPAEGDRYCASSDGRACPCAVRGCNTLGVGLPRSIHPVCRDILKWNDIEGDKR